MISKKAIEEMEEEFKRSWEDRLKYRYARHRRDDDDEEDDDTY